MSNTIKLKKGLDIPLSGKAALKIGLEVKPGIVALKPTDFRGLVPKLLVKEGDKVLAGTPLFADKMCQDILFTSPVSGTVQSIVRGEKRKLLAVLVKEDGLRKSVDFGKNDPDKMSPDEIKSLLLKSGLWASLIQRPYGIVANPAAAPKAVFVSGFNTAPNAADVDFTLGSQAEFIQKGISAVAKMAGCPLHLGLCSEKSPLATMKDATIHFFKGAHPAGNVGVQISAVSPIAKGDVVWTISPMMLAAIGKLLSTGSLDMTRTVAITGPKAVNPCYVKTVAGMSMKSIADFIDADTPDCLLRIVSGDALSGTAVGGNGFLGFFDDQVTILGEDPSQEMFGWMNPIRSRHFSASRAYFSRMCPNKKYDMETNLHGGVRAFMFNSIYSDVFPMDLFPVYLAKACLAGDIDKMEEYGIYEVLPEDFATCEFICPSKIEWQSIIEQGIQLMLKEMA